MDYFNLENNSEEVIIKDENLSYTDCGDAVFLNIRTNRGNLQFAVYNAHNGYYGHSAYVVGIDKEVKRFCI